MNELLNQQKIVKLGIKRKIKYKLRDQDNHRMKRLEDDIFESRSSKVNTLFDEKGTSCEETKRKNLCNSNEKHFLSCVLSLFHNCIVYSAEKTST